MSVQLRKVEENSEQEDRVVGEERVITSSNVQHLVKKYEEYVCILT